MSKRVGTKHSPTCAEEALAFKLIDDAKMLLKLSRLPMKESFWCTAGTMQDTIKATKMLKDRKSNTLRPGE